MGKTSAEESEVWYWIVAFRGSANWREVMEHLRALDSFETKGCFVEDLSAIWIRVDHPDGRFRIFGKESPYVLAAESPEPNRILTERICDHLLGLLEPDPDAIAPGAVDVADAQTDQITFKVR